MLPTICFKFLSPTQYARRVFLLIATFTGKQLLQDKIQELLEPVILVEVDQ
jgi:hypothetical protein